MALTMLRPDVVILSRTARIVIMSELTVPWEDNVEEAHERKKEKYEQLVMQCEEHGPIVIPLRGSPDGLLYSR